MGILSGLRARLRALFRRTAADRELSDEIRFHIELETEKNVRLGYSADEARRLAMSHFGGVQRVREEHRYRVFAPLERDASRFPRALWRRSADGVIDKREVVVWCPNDYLGMGRHPQVIAAMQRAAAE